MQSQITSRALTDEIACPATMIFGYQNCMNKLGVTALKFLYFYLFVFKCFCRVSMQTSKFVVFKNFIVYFFEL